MVKIRLKQIGRKNAKKYRIVVSDVNNRRDGKDIEVLGMYNPMPGNSEMKLEIEKVDSWTKKGAVMTERVQKIYNLVKSDKVERNG